MAKIDPAKMWSLNYRLLGSVLGSVSAQIEALGLETKDLFLLAEVEDHPHPAELATALLMPRPTVTVAVKRLEAAGYLKREIDAKDLRKHKLTLTPAGRRAATKGLALLSEAFERRLDRLSGSQQHELRSLLEKLTQPLGRAGLGEDERGERARKAGVDARI